MKNLFATTLLALAAIMTACSPSPPAAAPPTAVNGVMDLRQWDLAKQGPVKLDGTWLFYWKRFLDPKKNSEPGTAPSPQSIRVPSQWRSVVLDDAALPAKGYASYRLKILLRDADEPLAFKFTTVGSAFECFVNGRLISSAGRVGVSENDMTARYHPHVAEFIPPGKELDVVIHVANFQQDYSGLWFSLNFGRARDLNRFYQRIVALDFFLGGVFFIMFLYHLTLLVLRRRDLLPLYFALFCLIMTVRIFSQGEFVLSDLFPGMTFKQQLSLRYLTFYLAIPVMALFLWTSFPREYSRYVLYVSLGLGASFSLFFLVTPLPVGTRTLELYQINALLQIAYGFWAMVLAIRRRRDGAVVLCLGVVIIALTAVNDMLYANLIIPTGYYFGYGLLLLIFSQSGLLSIRFSRAFQAVESLTDELAGANRELTDLNQNLERKVTERTVELQAAYDEMAAINERLQTARDQLWGEMQLAKKIQTVLLPQCPSIPGYAIAARMMPANDVGGDYYDIINVEGYDWIVIGDVSGHGVPAGLIMMMVQSSIHSILEHDPGLHPSVLIRRVNRTLRKNLAKLDEDKYMTITVLMAARNGILTFSGLHQDILVYRAQSAAVEVVETDGFWIGVMDEIGPLLRDDTLRLDDGDTMLLFTDGITEAWEAGTSRENRNPLRSMYGQERLSDALCRRGGESPDLIIDGIMDSLRGYHFHDDVTMVVVRRLGAR